MAVNRTRQLIAAQAIIYEIPPVGPARTVDRSFELPATLYLATVSSYLGFIGVMALGFGNPELVVPIGIFIVFIGMFFTVPALWMRMKPQHGRRLTAWESFGEQGILTAYGHTTAKAAVAQVMILPALIFAWGIVVVAIAAAVR
jgi:hypothetical protein